MSKQQAKQTALLVLDLKEEPQDGLTKVLYQAIIKELCDKK